MSFRGVAIYRDDVGISPAAAGPHLNIRTHIDIYDIVIRSYLTIKFPLLYLWRKGGMIVSHILSLFYRFLVLLLIIVSLKLVHIFPTSEMEEKMQRTIYAGALIFIIIFIMAMGILPLGGCGGVASPAAVAKPVEVELTFPNGAPVLGKTAELRCDITGATDNITVVINLPSGFQLVSGSLSYTGPVGTIQKEIVRSGNSSKTVPVSTTAGTVTIKPVIKAIELGDWEITVKAGGITYPDPYQLYVLVSEKSAVWSKEPFSDARPWTGFKVERPPKK